MPPATNISNPPIPEVDERFVVKAPFKGRGGTRTIVRMLNADGHIDVAHKMGLISLRSEILERWIESTEQVNEEDEKFVSQTRWCMVRVTAVVKSPDGTGTITADGTSTANDRDKFVKQPGYEVLVAETRAIKRALANACNITEKFISPDAKAPTRETVDMPLPKDDIDDSPGLPQDMLRKPDISPPIEGIRKREEVTSGGEQFIV